MADVAYSQAVIDTVTLKKGEVFDILLINQKPDSKADLQTYFQTAFPVATKMSYQSIPKFKIVGWTQGNIQPAAIIMGKWNSLQLREDFGDRVIEEVPYFHSLRRKIWSFFGLRYFEMKSDVTFMIRRDHYHVATAYWMDGKKKSSEFYKTWLSQVQAMNGEVLIELEDGASPFGYQYNPDVFVITAWESEAAFKAFQAKNEGLMLDNIVHVNEFILK